MDRRGLLKGGAAAMAAAVAMKAEAQAAAAGAREFYLLRRYRMASGPNGAIAGKYFSGALLPALQRMGIGPVGVFNLSYGDATPQTFVLMPSTDVKALAMLDLTLAGDATFVKDAAPFWAAPAVNPVFEGVDSKLSIAFEGYPKLTLPAKEPRILQLRTYISPTHATHERKVEMFGKGEFRIFKEAGAQGVFYSDDLIGSRTPSLTYMLAHKDLAAMDANWKAFMGHPDWKKLSTDPRYASEPTVSHIDNLVLTPAGYSQI